MAPRGIPRKLSEATELLAQQIAEMQGQLSDLAQVVRDGLEGRARDGGDGDDSGMDFDPMEGESVADWRPEGGLSPEERLELEQLRREVPEVRAMLETAGPTRPGLRVHQSGAVSLYGLQRYPLTLYKGQWRRLRAMMEEVDAFLDANERHPAIMAADQRHEREKVQRRASIEARGGTGPLGSGNGHRGESLE